ncbi:MFS transporter [Paenibacillus mucilaginosus]|uniref:Sugar/Na+ simporter n=3 Tax=Paenibacillus mucilaginosus TaxID=61624 RepID=H6NJF6_9BACL|nr:MFS transporter [Paenibacillus mucilaginosus]AEI40617.1 sugar/Na+(H+) simporter [Paenibacillus mucilaginosus KNP414]AFC29235.1 sugar/Na+ simporter [Paenibacillus mucilaginosus 3016]AFH61415.1 sugar/Na+(H+) simporter [Paenibacillus mucilaginosus K02]MCG7216256.1 MFS transporter [Paenibacillus mucilaginosus]WDM29762.1 MFS transporter [Paenibacillus mucilaginosus]
MMERTLVTNPDYTLTAAKETSKGKLGIWEKAAYGSGDLAINFYWSTVMTYMLFFYTDVAKIPAAIVGTMFLIVRILDGFVDLGMGVVIDRTQTRWGKLRPFILFGALPMAVIGVLCFTVPDFGLSGKIIYAYITYIGIMVMMSFIGTPYGALTSAMTQDPLERVSLSSYRIVGSMIGGIIVSVMTPIIIDHFWPQDLSSGYRNTLMIYSVFALIFYMICFAGTKERVSAQEAVKIPLKKSLHMLFTNRPLMLITFIYLVFQAAYGIKASVSIYYVTYNMSRTDFLSIFMMLVFGGNLLGTLLAPLLTKWFEKKYVIMIGMAGTVLSGIGLYLTDYTNLPMIILWTLVGSIIGGIPAAVIWGALPDTVEYSEWKHGVRTEGLVYGIFSFGQKLSIAISGALSGYILQISGYVPDTVQTPTALTGIAGLFCLLPAGLCVLGIIASLFYNLDSKLFATIIGDLKKKQAASSK